LLLIPLLLFFPQLDPTRPGYKPENLKILITHVQRIVSGITDHAEKCPK
jgi:hypothetical protein